MPLPGRRRDGSVDMVSQAQSDVSRSIWFGPRNLDLSNLIRFALVAPGALVFYRLHSCLQCFFYHVQNSPFFRSQGFRLTAPFAAVSRASLEAVFQRLT